MLMVDSMRLGSETICICSVGGVTLSILEKYALRKHADLWDLISYIHQGRLEKNNTLSGHCCTLKQHQHGAGCSSNCLWGLKLRLYSTIFWQCFVCVDYKKHRQHTYLHVSAESH